MVGGDVPDMAPFSVQPVPATKRALFTAGVEEMSIHVARPLPVSSEPTTIGPSAPASMTAGDDTASGADHPVAPAASVDPQIRETAPPSSAAPSVCSQMAVARPEAPVVTRGSDGVPATGADQGSAGTVQLPPGASVLTLTVGAGVVV